MDATSDFIFLCLGGALHFYYLPAKTEHYWIWHIAAAVVALLCVYNGSYPPFFPREQGFFTPNRTVGLLIYLLLFNGCVAASAFNQVSNSFRQAYRELITLKYGAKEDHRP